jgi:hypothetical protein
MKVLQVTLNKKQTEYILKKSGEKTVKKAFRMFVRAMTKEAIKVQKMPILIDKMMAKDKKEVK